MTAISLFLLGLLTVVDGKFNCALPVGFERSNPNMIPQGFKDLGPDPDIYLHEYLFKYGITLGKGAFGEVKTAAGIDPPVVMKKVVSNGEVMDQLLISELTFLKRICGFQTEKAEQTLLTCDSTAIAGYRGCVEKGNVVFIFQEPMTRDLLSIDAQQMYRKLDGKQKARVMVNLIRKYQQIHDKKIVHNDIKPANIMMKNNNFDDLRIVDFGLALDFGTESKSGTPLYFAPERHVEPAATYRSDVYSLAITFLTMEKEGMEGMDLFGKMYPKCFSFLFDGPCEKELRKILENTFSVKNKLDFLFRVFCVASNPGADRRYKTMEKFAEAVEDAIQSKEELDRQGQNANTGGSVPYNNNYDNNNYRNNNYDNNNNNYRNNNYDNYIIIQERPPSNP